MKRFTTKEAMDIISLQNAMLLVLADIVESRDVNTGDHIHKTAGYVSIITDEMYRKGYYRDIINEEFIDCIVHSAPLHDIGKISISDAILNKPDRLTEDEFEEMKTHAKKGSEIIQRISDRLPKNTSFMPYLNMAKDVAEYHHEKWNGTGYPNGIKGKEIPLVARIMAVADVFDTLTSKRVYKDPMPFDCAVRIIAEESGKQFDPLVVDAFLSAIEDVQYVAEGFQSRKKCV